MNFSMTEVTNKNIVTRPESGQRGLNVNSNPYMFGPEHNVSYGWNWIGKDATEKNYNRVVSHFAFGSACVGRHGEIYYVFRKAVTHGVIEDPTSPFYNVGGDLYYTVSYDFGETWADPVMFLEHTEGMDLRDVTLEYYPEHDMYVLIYEDTSVDYSSRSGTLHILSTPNLARPRAGDSILDPFPITNMSEWTLPAADMFSQHNQTFGKLVPVGNYFYLPFYGTSTGTHLGAGILRFSRAVEGLPSGTVLKKWSEDTSNECTFFTTCNGSGIIRFNMLFRGGNNSSTGDNAMLSYSDDFGATWSEKEDLGFNAAGGPQVYDMNGTLMLVARDQLVGGINYSYAMFSKDGRTWSNRTMIAPNGTCYSSIVQLNNGRTLLFYSRELTKSLIFMREVYRVPEVLDTASGE